MQAQLAEIGGFVQTLKVKEPLARDAERSNSLVLPPGHLSHTIFVSYCVDMYSFFGPAGNAYTVSGPADATANPGDEAGMTVVPDVSTYPYQSRSVVITC